VSGAALRQLRVPQNAAVPCLGSSSRAWYHAPLTRTSPGGRGWAKLVSQCLPNLSGVPQALPVLSATRQQHAACSTACLTSLEDGKSHRRVVEAGGGALRL
jgi:hypothetical protein